MPSYQDAILLVLPMFHAFGQSLLLHGLKHGCKLIIMNSFQPAEYLQNMQDFKVSHFLTKVPIPILHTKGNIFAKCGYNNGIKVHCVISNRNRL